MTAFIFTRRSLCLLFEEIHTIEGICFSDFTVNFTVFCENTVNFKTGGTVHGPQSLIKNKSNRTLRYGSVYGSVFRKMLPVFAKKVFFVLFVLLFPDSISVNRKPYVKCSTNTALRDPVSDLRYGPNRKRKIRKQIPSN